MSIKWENRGVSWVGLGLLARARRLPCSAFPRVLSQTPGVQTFDKGPHTCSLLRRQLAARSARSAYVRETQNKIKSMLGMHTLVRGSIRLQSLPVEPSLGRPFQVRAWHAHLVVN